jgi:uncharacterized membrane protein YjjP (DUF1212 family)
MVNEPNDLSRWTMSLVAIVTAGAVFGLIEGGFAGLIVGGIIATMYGVPIVLTIAVLTWAFWLSRFPPIAAAVAGSATGILATAMSWDRIFSTDYYTAIVLAACIGGIVPGVVLAYSVRAYRERNPATGKPDREGWHFSLADLFWRFTMVAILIAIWSIGLASFR